LSPEEANSHPQKSLITKALMGNPETEPFIQLINVEPDDLFLLCTDGLSSVINESEISKILREDGVTEIAAEKLKSAVYKSGAPDNITLVLAKLTNEELNTVGILGAAAVVA
jgi:serine/threonine protein phosphatase PrpC